MENRYFQWMNIQNKMNYQKIYTSIIENAKKHVENKFSPYIYLQNIHTLYKGLVQL